MTLKERIIVEVYTGYCMTSPEERDEVYKYMAEKMDRPVYTHELASKEIQERLREKTLDDFKGLCISDEKWKRARENVIQSLTVFRHESNREYIRDLAARYSMGERTLELYEEMIRVI